jgi:hypothetical protein
MTLHAMAETTFRAMRAGPPLAFARGMRTLTFASLLLLPAAAVAASAQPLGVVAVGDLPGTGARWQMGEVTVAAPAAEVQHWFSDATRWTQRFPDDDRVRTLGRLPDSRQVVEFHSKALKKTLTVRLREQPGLITYDGSGKDITTQGKIIIEPLAPNRTKVIMQTTGELHGLVGLVGKGEKRKRALAKLNADLDAVARLSRLSANAAPRSGG